MKHSYITPLLSSVLLFSLLSCSSTPDKSPDGSLVSLGDSKQALFISLHAAAKKGDTNSQLRLAKCYDFGEGTAKNLPQAISWYTKAAERGSAEAQDSLGSIYISGDDAKTSAKDRIGIPRNTTLALQWYKKAAAQGYAPAYNNLGLCYHNGDGVAVDEKSAVQYYRIAAEKGNVDGAYNLGRCYFHGIGVTKSLPNALEWLRKASAQGQQDAAGFMRDNMIG